MAGVCAPRPATGFTHGLCNGAYLNRVPVRSCKMAAPRPRDELDRMYDDLRN